MSDEYTWCPCACGGLVRIWGTTGINACCKPCWETFWEATVAHLEGSTECTQNYGHSEQCEQRQAVRAGIVPVTDRDFHMMGRDPVEALRAVEEDPD